MRKKYLVAGLIALSLIMVGCGKTETTEKYKSDSAQTNENTDVKDSAQTNKNTDVRDSTQANENTDVKDSTQTNENTNVKDPAKTDFGKWVQLAGLFAENTVDKDLREGKQSYCINIFSDFDHDGQIDDKEIPLEITTSHTFVLPFDSGEEDSLFKADGEMTLLNFHVKEGEKSTYGVEYTDRLSDVPELMRSANVWDKEFADPRAVIPANFGNVLYDFMDGHTTFTPSENKEVNINGVPFIRETGEIDIRKDESVIKFNYVAYYYVNSIAKSEKIEPTMGMMLWTTLKDVVDPKYSDNKDLSSMLKLETKYIDQLEDRADAAMNTLTPLPYSTSDAPNSISYSFIGTFFGR